MSQPAREESFESRTQLVGSKRSLANISNTTRPRKRRRNDVEHNKGRNFKPNDNQYSALSQQPDLDESSNRNSVDTRTSQAALNPDAETTLKMADQGLGRNRLSAGFTRPKSTRQDSKSSGEITSDSSPKPVHGQSSVSPIEISDDEMEESEGGMVINLDGYGAAAHVLSSDDMESEESGEIASTPQNAANPTNATADLFVIDPTPQVPMKRLVDLDSAELDEQLRYAFYYLNRDQIDLSRPVLCLVCSGEGHLQHNCEGKASEPSLVSKSDNNTQFKLWISCCICASKSHLAGDCAYLEGRQADRWSLKSFNSEQIVNLSLESGIQNLEKEAENRNMRPAGLRIRGRAGLHHTGVQTFENTSDDDDEPFVRKPVGKRQADIRDDPSRNQRYDRYDPPPDRQNYRGGGKWYATDSFGRRRSRSPEDQYDSYRPRNEHFRPQESPHRDSWRPPAAAENREPYRGRRPSPPRDRRVQPAASKSSQGNGPRGNIQFSLPTRKGSNAWSQNGQSGTSTPTSNGKPNNSEASRKKKGRNKKKGPRNG